MKYSEYQKQLLGALLFFVVLTNLFFFPIFPNLIGGGSAIAESASLNRKNAPLPKLWIFSGIPQREAGENDLEASEEYSYSLRIPNVISDESRCNSTNEPAYYGVVDVARGYLSLTKCIPEETFNSTDRITSAAFATASGETLFVTTNVNRWHRSSKISSTKPLSELLPPNFSVSSFMKPGSKIDTNGLVIFYLDLELPHHGTDTLAHIRMVPVGLQIKRDSAVLLDNDSLLVIPQTGVVSGKQNEISLVSTADRELLLSFIEDPFDKHSSSESLAFKAGIEAIGLRFIRDIDMSSKPWDQMTAEEKGNAAKQLSDAAKGYKITGVDSVDKQLAVDSVREKYFLGKLEYLHMLHKAWNSLAWQTIILGWDKNADRFYIKGGKQPSSKLDFNTFCIPAESGEVPAGAEFFSSDVWNPES